MRKESNLVRLVKALLSNHRLLERFRVEPQAVADRYRISEAELIALQSGDELELARCGVNLDQIGRSRPWSWSSLLASPTARAAAALLLVMAASLGTGTAAMARVDKRAGQPYRVRRMRHAIRAARRKRAGERMGMALRAIGKRYVAPKRTDIRSLSD